MIDFLKYRWITAFFSTFIILVGMVGLYFYNVQTRGRGFNYSIEFTGGSQALLRFAQPVPVKQIHEILEVSGWKGAETREFSAHEVLIRVKEFSHDAQSVGESMQKALATALPDNQVTILQSEAVGPSAGKELRDKSMNAIIFALLAMLFYIAFSFWSFSFAAGAILALVHDGMVMLAMFLMLERDISINVIGAILAVLGYSINDTIVIFSQIRHNLKVMPEKSLYDIVNISTNQTLRRTLLTSLATSLTVVSMLILGGEALRDFSLTLLVGIVFGTYSSIYVAGPVMMLLYNREMKKA